MGLEEFSLPLCIIPKEILRDYDRRVGKFYSDDGKRRIEEYKRAIEGNYDVEFKRLYWDKTSGLTNISFMGGGLDLIRGRFVFHNIIPESNHGKAAFEVARKYLELLSTENGRNKATVLSGLSGF